MRNSITVIVCITIFMVIGSSEGSTHSKFYLEDYYEGLMTGLSANVYSPVYGCTDLNDDVMAASLLMEKNYAFYKADNETFTTYNFLVDFVSVFATALSIRDNCNLMDYIYQVYTNVSNLSFWK